MSRAQQEEHFLPSVASHWQSGPLEGDRGDQAVFHRFLASASHVFVHACGQMYCQRSNQQQQVKGPPRPPHTRWPLNSGSLFSLDTAAVNIAVSVSPPPATSYCLRRSDILLTAQLPDSLTVSVSSRSTHLLPSAVICYMQPSFTLVATCPFCPTEVAPAVIIPRWSLTNGRMTNSKRTLFHFFFHVEEISYDLNSYATFSELVVI